MIKRLAVLEASHFVTMNDNAEGQAAIKAFDGRQFGGRAAREDRAFVAVLPGASCFGQGVCPAQPKNQAKFTLLRRPFSPARWSSTD